MADAEAGVGPPGRAGGLAQPAVTPRPLPAYRDMFLLTDAELRAGPILDCPAGASPFGAQVRGMGELARVTRGEVRVFPVHTTDGRTYPHLDAVRSELHRRGRSTELRSAGASYALSPASDRMLVLAPGP